MNKKVVKYELIEKGSAVERCLDILCNTGKH